MSISITLFRLFSLHASVSRFESGAIATISVYIYKMGAHFSVSSID